MGIENRHIQPLRLDTNGLLCVNANHIDEPFVIVISDGKAKSFTLPPFGEFEAVTYQGKVKHTRIVKSELW